VTYFISGGASWTPPNRIGFDKLCSLQSLCSLKKWLLSLNYFETTMFIKVKHKPVRLYLVLSVSLPFSFDELLYDYNVIIPCQVKNQFSNIKFVFNWVNFIWISLFGNSGMSVTWEGNRNNRKSRWEGKKNYTIDLGGIWTQDLHHPDDDHWALDCSHVDCLIWFYFDNYASVGACQILT